MKIRLKVDTATRKWLMTADSFKHPAKMNIPLLFWIVQRYTRPGDIILDPMAGTGTTMLACWIGRNVILVELEEKFVKMCEANWQKLQQMPPALGFEMGWCVIRQGDARNLEGLLCDVVLTSPPYSESVKARGSPEQRRERLIKAGYNPKDYQGGRGRQCQMVWEYSKSSENIGNLPHGSIDSIITSPPYAKQMSSGGGIAKEHESNWKYGDMEGQIGNLPYEIADSIITSPPYAEAQSGGGIAKEGYKGSKHSPTDLVGRRTYMSENVGDNPENIALLPYADAVITSPPYAESTHHSDDPRDTERYRPGQSSRVAGTAGDRQDNIGQLPYVDTVVTSPPYAEAHDPEPGGLTKANRKDLLSYSYLKDGNPDNIQNLRYSDGEPNQIGKPKGQTYLSEMQKVYQQCWKCLKPEGLLIIVVKNFIRNKRIVPLDEHTIILCQNAGFSLEERHYRELTSQSFWRTIYREKYPDAPTIDREEILVFRKSTSKKVDHENQRNENENDS